MGDQHHKATRAVTAVLVACVVGALLVRVGGVSPQVLVSWSLVAVVLGCVTLLRGRGGGGGGPGRLIPVRVPVRAHRRRR